MEKRKVLKRNTLKNIQETFKKSSWKVRGSYILNVEKTTKEAMNALLKILEEPQKVFMQFLQLKISTGFYQRLYLRCQGIELKLDNKEVLKEN